MIWDQLVTFSLPGIAYKDACMRDSFSSMKKNNEITFHLCLQLMTRQHQSNTRLDIRKTSIDVTEKTPRSKDDTKKDSNPWLDKNDPRRHMTGKEIFESIINMPEACITERQKHTLYKSLLKYKDAFSLGMKLEYVKIWK